MCWQALSWTLTHGHGTRDDNDIGRKKTVPFSAKFVFWGLFALVLLSHMQITKYFILIKAHIKYDHDNQTCTLYVCTIHSFFIYNKFNWNLFWLCKGIINPILVMIQNSENPVSLPAWIYGADLETPDSDILWDMTYDLVLTWSAANWKLNPTHTTQSASSFLSFNLEITFTSISK